jgi:hypothetical protein
LTALRERLEERFRVERMILFGSRARGDHLLSSDVDVIIVSPDFADLPFLQRIREVAVLWDGDVPLEPVCYTPEEFARKRLGIGIARRAAEEGREVTASRG